MAEQWLIEYAEQLDAGIALANQSQWEAAIEKYDAAIAITPSLSPSYINRGLALHHLERYAEALHDLDCAAAIQPQLAVIYRNRSVIYREMGQREASAADCIKAIELGGENAVDGYAHGNLATYYFHLTHYDLAVQHYQKSVELLPDDAVNRWNYGMCLLLRGDFENGWREYHWRWREARYVEGHRNVGVPMWLGQASLNGKTILLLAEQGFGDQIQFCRYASIAAAQGARVLLEVRPGLMDLCKSLAGVSQVFTVNDPLPHFDFYCPMMSLPLAFNTTLQNIPASVPYLASDPVKVHMWQSKLGVKTKPRIGIVWSSDPTLAVGASKTIPLEAFAEVLSDDFEFFSLQKNLWYQEQAMLTSLGVHHFGDELGDFSDTAALCECMDLIISVDTSVAHLAGALGKPVCILLHTNPDWRWLLERSDSVWYPTAKLYRQEKMFEWNQVLGAVKADLQQQLPALHKN